MFTQGRVIVCPVPGTHQRSLVGAGGGEPFDRNVVLDDELVKVAVPVGNRRPEYGGGLPHPLPARRVRAGTAGRD